METQFERGKESEGHPRAFTTVEGMRALYSKKCDLVSGFVLFSFLYGLFFGTPGLEILSVPDFAR